MDVVEWGCMEKEKNLQEKESKTQEEKQVCEGLIGKYQEGWQKRLPAGIKPDDVDLFLGSDGLWHWHLKPDLINDEKERERYKTERKRWLQTLESEDE